MRPTVIPGNPGILVTSHHPDLILIRVMVQCGSACAVAVGVGWGELLHAVIQRRRLHSSSGSTPPGTSEASGSSRQIKERELGRLHGKVLGSRPENGLYCFCSHSVGQSSGIWPHHSEGEAGKYSLALPQSPVTFMLS